MAMLVYQRVMFLLCLFFREETMFSPSEVGPSGNGSGELCDPVVYVCWS